MYLNLVYNRFIITLQLVEESSDKQEALQAVCHQQTATAACAGFPEGKAEGKWAGRLSPYLKYECVWASVDLLNRS